MGVCKRSSPVHISLSSFSFVASTCLYRTDGQRVKVDGGTAKPAASEDEEGNRAARAGLPRVSAQKIAIEVVCRSVYALFCTHSASTTAASELLGRS